MDVEFISVSKEKLDTVPIIDGQIIAVDNKDECYYDIHGIRRSVGGQLLVKSLPEQGRDNILYVVNDSSDKSKSGLFIWDSATNSYCPIFTSSKLEWHEF